jgi:selT/selW/selH-like putative selenoprotein
MSDTRLDGGWMLTLKRTMACSAGLGRAPPKVINIEYDPEDLEAFILLADAIEEAFPTVVVKGNEEQEGRPGSFEIQTDDGLNVYSRLATKTLPGPQEVLRRISMRAKLAGADEENRPFCG